MAETMPKAVMAGRTSDRADMPEDIFGSRYRYTTVHHKGTKAQRTINPIYQMGHYP